MGRIVLVGAGVAGLGAAMFLARDGHQVIVLERDPASPPDDPSQAWERWQRPGVNQFHWRMPFWPDSGALSTRNCPRWPRRCRPRAGCG